MIWFVSSFCNFVSRVTGVPPEVYPSTGCKTAIFSENDNLSKTGFQEKIYTHTYTEYWVQFLNGFAIFHTPQGTHEVWKIAKKPNPLVKFGCVIGCVKL